jgi:Ca-activated chloride channel homolog
VVELLATAGVIILAAAAEWLHAFKVARVARLAFGPRARPASWARLAPALRVLSLGSLAWAFCALLSLDPKVHKKDEETPESEMRHLLVVMDVSPSMRLVDAGPEGKQSRRARARDLIESLLARVTASQCLVTIVATYNGAIPVVEKTRDLEVVRNIVDDLPLQYAFRSGGTDLFAGLAEAARIARPLRPGCATVLLISDGDTVPGAGMPRMPVSVAHVLVLGVGSPRHGTFVDGRQSKQEASTLRQIAARLNGIYHDGNEKHISTDTLREIAQSGRPSDLDRLTKREYALLACGLAAAALALLPLALQSFGAAWRPGVADGVRVGDRVAAGSRGSRVQLGQREAVGSKSSGSYPSGRRITFLEP